MSFPLFYYSRSVIQAYRDKNHILKVYILFEPVLSNIRIYLGERQWDGCQRPDKVTSFKRCRLSRCAPLEIAGARPIEQVARPRPVAKAAVERGRKLGREGLVLEEAALRGEADGPIVSQGRWGHVRAAPAGNAARQPLRAEQLELVLAVPRAGGRPHLHLGDGGVSGPEERGGVVVVAPPAGYGERVQALNEGKGDVLNPPL